jgi:hypothetical protein
VRVQQRELRKLSWGVIVVLAVLAWIGIAGVGLAWMAVVDFEGDLYCQQPGSDSNYGKLSWSAVPPGPVCTYTAQMNGVDRVDGPTPVTSVWLLTLVGLGSASVWAVRLAVRDGRSSARERLENG